MEYNGKTYELVKQTEEENKQRGISMGCCGCAFDMDTRLCKNVPSDKCVSESGNDFEMIWKEVKDGI